MTIIQKIIAMQEEIVQMEDMMDFDSTLSRKMLLNYEKFADVYEEVKSEIGLLRHVALQLRFMSHAYHCYRDLQWTRQAMGVAFQEWEAVR